MEKGEFEESFAFNLGNLLEYSSNSILVKNICVHNNCTIQAYAFDFGKVLTQEEIPSIRFIQVIEGKAEVVMDGNSTFLQCGDSIIIPGFVPSSIEANQKFKMICTTIKSN